VTDIVSVNGALRSIRAASAVFGQTVPGGKRG
jgi:hypothetical protein